MTQLRWLRSLFKEAEPDADATSAAAAAAAAIIPSSYSCHRQADKLPHVVTE